MRNKEHETIAWIITSSTPAKTIMPMLVEKRMQAIRMLTIIPILSWFEEFGLFSVSSFKPESEAKREDLARHSIVLRVSKIWAEPFLSDCLW